MYSTCIFCHGDLERNEVVEAFPVGRRLAFDAVKGRLWVVCRRCERWNLTPIEERWEAIDTCERLFRDTHLRASTDNIGLARLREGLELVRIGPALRPEFAAWRYGDQFGRRRKKFIGLSVVGGAAVLAATVAPLYGVVAGVGAGGWGLFQVGNFVYQLVTTRTVRARVVLPGHSDPAILRSTHLLETALGGNRDTWMLRLTHELPPPDMNAGRWARERWPKLSGRRTTTVLSGPDALHAAGKLLPLINSSGGNRVGVRRAVDLVDKTPDPDRLFASAILSSRQPTQLRVLPAHVRLALEMAAHENVERRALEGELALLETAWREADEIAAIADSLLIPGEVSRRLGTMREKPTDA